jgi:rfaE bifunctional protein kinase chain/domain/rfaE bifunctional protein nucleotidyltransferase chain/domain
MDFDAKIKTLDTLAEVVADLKAAGKTVVHCHGVFDLLHIGHIRYFSQAKELGDILVVTLTPDHFVDKGPHRPAFTQRLRAQALASLSDVDFVAISETPTAVEVLRLLRPDVYVKGEEFKDVASDMTGKIGLEAKVVEEIGAKLAFTGDIVFSSSNLINRYLSNFPDEFQEYLTIFRQRYPLSAIIEAVDKMRELRVLVVGDTILDEYQYGQAIGKSSKDPVLALKYQARDIFAGGALAVANHVADFAGEVGILTVLGANERHEAFIESQLDPAIRRYFHTRQGAPTILKRRVIDSDSLIKLLELYIMDDAPIPDALDAAMADNFTRIAGDYDLVIVADFGHSTIGPRLLEALCDKAPYLAVNTQANAGNRGFNTISRYKRADLVSLAEHELRLETRDMERDLRLLMTGLRDRMGAAHFLVTTGRKGCCVLGEDGAFVKVPAFVAKVVDRVGSGDAFFSVVAMAARQGLPIEIIGFLGNAAGSQAVEIIGNKKSISSLTIKKFVTSFMK